MDCHVVLPPTLCKVTWIVTHKIATKICITQQDLANEFDNGTLKIFQRKIWIIVSSKWAKCVVKRKRYVLIELLETLRNRTAEGRGQQNWSCDARDNLIREPFDATSGLRLPSSWRSRRENKATEVVRRTWVFLSPYFNLNCLFLRL